MDIPQPLLALVPAAALALYVGWKATQRRHRGSSLNVPYRTLKEGLLAGDGQLSVLSYNTLCDSLVAGNPEGYSDTAAVADLLWDNRWPRLQTQLVESQADVLALQEVDPLRWQEFESALSAAGYDGVMQDRRKDSLSFTLAFFYRRDRVQLVWQESRTRTQVAAFQLLHGSKQTVYMVNMHLEGNPYRAGERVNQIRSALRRLQSKLAPGSSGSVTSLAASDILADKAVLMLGDYNSSKQSCVYRYASSGYLPARSTEAFMPAVPVTKEDARHAFKFADAYDGSGRLLPFTFKRGLYSGQLIDFILYTPATLGLGSLLRPLDDSAFRLVQRKGLPNERFPSDHLPIGAIFDITADAASTDPAVAAIAVHHTSKDVSQHSRQSLHKVQQETDSASSNRVDAVAEYGREHDTATASGTSAVNHHATSELQGGEMQHDEQQRQPMQGEANGFEGALSAHGGGASVRSLMSNAPMCHCGALQDEKPEPSNKLPS